MMKTSVLKVHPRLRVLMICIILHGEAKTSVAGSNSCDITGSTVKIVDDCPESEDQWIEAAARKNCTQYASQCSKPVVYHCVINPYVNQTLEVCAIAQNIVLGQCTSYFKSGNVIQENSRTDCSEFKVNACPQFYRSDVAYKYPGCYKLTKKLTTIRSTRNPDTTVPFTTPSSYRTLNKQSDMTGKGNKMGDSIVILIIIVSFISVVIIVLVVFAVRRVIGKKNKGRQSLGKIPKAGTSYWLRSIVRSISLPRPSGANATLHIYVRA